MKSINETLTNLSREPAFNNRLAKQRAAAVWPKVVGEEISRRTRAEFVKDSVLRVAVVSSTWLNELHMCRLLLIDKINSCVKERIVDIRFYVDAALEEKEDGTTSVKEINRGDQEASSDKIRQLSENIADPELKNRFSAAYNRQQFRFKRGGMND